MPLAPNGFCLLSLNECLAWGKKRRAPGPWGAAPASSGLSDARKQPLPTLPAFPSVNLLGVGPVSGLGAGGSPWGMGVGSLSSLAEAGHWGPTVWLGFGSKPAVQGGCGGSQESREARNRRRSSRREAETGRGCEEAGETDGKAGEELRRRLQPAGGGGALWCSCLPVGLLDKPAPPLSTSGTSWLLPEGQGRGLEVRRTWQWGGRRGDGWRAFLP